MEHQYSVPHIDLVDEDYDKIRAIIESGWVSIGERMEELESTFCLMYGVKHAIACSSATTGLTIAINSAGWKGKRIAVPSFTWPSTIYAIESTQDNVPVFCDINKDTWLMEPIVDDIKTRGIDAAIAVDTFGSECHEITDVPVIYDAAHGFDLPNLGHRGLAEVVSFSFTKLVTAMEGGMILTNHDSIAETAVELRRLSGRMGEINALVALKSMKNYDRYREETQQVVDKYMNGFTFPFKIQHAPIARNNSVFAIMLKSPAVRDSIVNTLESNGVEVKVYYDPIVWGLPNTDYVFSRIVALPIRKNIVEDQDKVIELINRAAHSVKDTPGKGYMERSGYVR